MAKKSVMSEAGDAMRTVAGAALGAAAIAATGVVVAKLSGAIRQGGKELEDAAPSLQKMAADTVTKPILPTRQKRSAATRTAKSTRRKAPAKKVAKKVAKKGGKATAKRRPAAAPRKKR
jgi:hypothetical protein